MVQNDNRHLIKLIEIKDKFISGEINKEEYEEQIKYEADRRIKELKEENESLMEKMAQYNSDILIRNIVLNAEKSGKGTIKGIIELNKNNREELKESDNDG